MRKDRIKKYKIPKKILASMTVLCLLAGNTIPVMALPDPSDDTASKTRTVTSEEAFAMLEADEDGGIRAAVKNGTIYLGRGASICLGSSDTVYDSVSMDLTSQAAVSYRNGVLATDSGAVSGKVSGTFYLYNSKDPEMRTVDADNDLSLDCTIPENGIQVDVSAPVMEIKGTAAAAPSDAEYKAYISNTSAAYFYDRGSGITGAQYMVIPEGADTAAFIKDALKNGRFRWTTLPKGTSTIAKSEDEKVIFRVQDLVGNALIYGTDLETPVDVSTSAVEISGFSDSFYTSDITYSLIINTTMVNPSSLSVAVNAGGKKLTQSVNPSTDKDGYYKNAFSLSRAYIKSLAQGRGQALLQGKIDAANVNSNNVVLEVTFRDMNGTEYKDARTFRVDSRAPEIKMSYDNNSVKNGAYFNKERKLTLSINEQNFSETLLDMKVYADGNPYTLSDIREGNVDGCRIIEDMTDSQKDLEKDEYNSGRKITYIIGFGLDKDSDTDYMIEIGCSDAAGNVSGDPDTSSQQAPFSFTVDKVAPVMTAGLYDTNGKSYKLDDTIPVYMRGNASVRFDLTERNFSDDITSRTKCTLTSNDSEGNPIDVYPADSVSKIGTASLWENDGDRHSFTMDTFTADANYRLALEFSDLAGNTAVVDPVLFTIDRVPPECTIILTDGTRTDSYSEKQPSLYFDFFTNKTISINVDAKDRSSGVAEIAYAVYNPGRNASGTMNADIEDGITWNIWPGSLNILNQMQGFVYVRCTDMAGNAAYYNSQGFLIDTTSPNQPVITINTPDAGNGIYSGDVQFSFSVEDAESGGTYSGLRNVVTTVSSGGTVTRSNDYSSLFTNARNRTKKMSGTETVPAVDNNSNNVVIRVEATDWSGNTISAEKKIAIDITLPVISVEYNTPVEMDGCYNTTKTAKVTVKERNFDPAKVNMSITGDPEISSWSSSADRGDDTAHTCTITYSKDGRYSFGMSVTDLAGNRAEYGRTDQFTIDKTPPVAKVSFDNNKAANGKYYKEARNATVTVTDENFVAENISVDTEGAKSGWSGSGSEYSMNISCSQDGTYSIKISGTDRAGNTMKDIDIPEYIVDTTVPLLSVTGVEEGHAYNGEVVPVIAFADINIDNTNSSFNVKGAKDQTENLEFTENLKENGKEITIKDPPHIVQNDDIYTLTAVATDLAGNSVEKKIVYSINRYGSNFSVDEATKELIDTVYTNDPKDLVIKETNLNELSECRITYWFDSAETLLENTDYKIDHTENEGWNVYEYTIPTDWIKDDGRYDFVVTTKDNAGNEQNNQTKNVPVGFYYDKTSPSVVITGFKDHEVCEAKELKATVNVTDNISFDHMTVDIDGSTASYDAVDLDNGKMDITIGESPNFQKVTVEAFDSAGNSTKVERNVLVSEKGGTVIQELTGRDDRSVIIIVMIAAIAVCAGTGVVYLIRKKRRGKDTAEGNNTGDNSDSREEK